MPNLILHQSANGEEALVELEKIKHFNEKIIVLLDINMPVLNGWGFLDQMKNADNLGIKDMDIFMVSSSTNESDILKANSYPIVKNFIYKPLNLNILRTLVFEI